MEHHELKPKWESAQENVKNARALLSEVLSDIDLHEQVSSKFIVQMMEWQNTLLKMELEFRALK